MPSGFNERKAAHVAAYFALRQGGSINIVKLIKLVYLGDREFLKRYDAPILHDRLVSMPKGPVNSNTYNYASGQVRAEVWDSYLSDEANHMISCSNLAENQLDELSRAEIGVLDHIWNEFGHMTPWELVDYTHDNCAEWEDPQGSSETIPYERVLKVLGKGTAARDIAERIEAERLAIKQMEG
ncbi:Panacea domain-containing protein [Hyphomicrobium sp.]|uniref:Panacea domain-containing protein n=1 Tax=Hyphomicrobium sp. TaxID=82 RepID=UPI003F6EDC78